MHRSVEQFTPARQPGQAGGRGLWLRWVLAHVLLLSASLSLVVWLFYSTYYGIGALFALPLAVIAPFVAQWIGIRGVLKRRGEAWLWIVATILGSVPVAVILIVLPLVFGARSLLLLWGAALLGLTLGAAQWTILQRNISRAYWWIPATIAGLAAGISAGGFTGQSVTTFCASTGDRVTAAGGCGLLATVLTFAAGSAAFSIVTGTTLVWLFREGAEARASTLSRRQIALGAGVLGLVAVLFTVLGIRQGAADFRTADIRLNGVSMVSAQEGWAVGEATERWGYSPLQRWQLVGGRATRLACYPSFRGDLDGLSDRWLERGSV